MKRKKGPENTLSGLDEKQQDCEREEDGAGDQESGMERMRGVSVQLPHRAFQCARKRGRG